MELCVSDFLIESVHNPRKYMKKQCVFDVWVLPAAISKLVFVFFTHFVAEGRTILTIRHFVSAPVVRFKRSGQSVEGSGKA